MFSDQRVDCLRAKTSVADGELSRGNITNSDGEGGRWDQTGSAVPL